MVFLVYTTGGDLLASRSTIYYRIGLASCIVGLDNGCSYSAILVGLAIAYLMQCVHVYPDYSQPLIVAVSSWAPPSSPFDYIYMYVYC